MYRKYGILIFFITTVVSFNLVKGSCLEYGHSCWGAHGKRSGGPPIRHTDNEKSVNGELNVVNPVDDLAEYYRDKPKSMPASDETRNDRLSNLSLKYLFGKHGIRKLNKANNKMFNDMIMSEQPIDGNTDTDIYAAERWRRILPLKSIKNFDENLLEQMTQQDAQSLRDNSYYNIK